MSQYGQPVGPGTQSTAGGSNRPTTNASSSHNNTISGYGSVGTGPQSLGYGYSSVSGTPGQYHSSSAYASSTAPRGHNERMMQESQGANYINGNYTNYTSQTNHNQITPSPIVSQPMVMYPATPSPTTPVVVPLIAQREEERNKLQQDVFQMMNGSAGMENPAAALNSFQLNPRLSNESDMRSSAGASVLHVNARGQFELMGAGVVNPSQLYGNLGSLGGPTMLGPQGQYYDRSRQDG